MATGTTLADITADTSDIAVFEDIISAADATGAIAATGVATGIGAIVATGGDVTGVIAVTGTAAGGRTESVPAGVGRRTTTASYGFATEAL
ncbi:MAG TPA: hypothetical protein PKE16_11830 [Hyphomicrobium sp.]|nr:hypothetical protein [Hyphomicrobium sp.]